MPGRKPKPPHNADNPEQSRRFIEAARNAEAGETPESTDWAFEKVIPPKRQKDRSERPS
jgi:hypothetical protein